MRVHRKNAMSCLHVVVLFIILLIFYACAGESDTGSTGSTGSITFSIGLHSPKAEGLDRQATAINCAVNGISQVEGQVFDENNSYMTTGGPWNCSAGSGVITGVKVGSNRRVVIRARSALGNVIYRGEVTGIEVGEGNNDLGEITLYPLTVTAGNSPLGVVATPDGSYVYVANWDDDTVSVIRTLDHTVVNTISVGDSPLGVAVTPNGSFVYVVNAASDDVSVIQTSSNTVTSTISVGVDTNPLRAVVTPNGNFVYVTNLNGDSVSVIQTSDNTVLTTISVGTEPESVAVTPDGSRVYVNSPNDNTIEVIETSSNTVVATIPVGNVPLGIAVTPDGTNVYVANRLDDTVSVIRTSDNALIATIPVGGFPSSVAVTPGGRYVYVSNRDDNTLSIIQRPNNTVVDTISVGTYPWCVTVSPSGNFIYVSNRDDNTLSVIAGTDIAGSTEDAYEENDTLATAWYVYDWEMTWLSTIDGLGIQADDDWYRIDVTSGAERVLIECRFTDADGDIDIELYDSSGTLLEGGYTTNDDEFIDYTVPSGGTYYIRVYFGDQGNTYDLWWNDTAP